MADFVLRVGSQSAQGKRSNNEDRLVADVEHQLFLVADGMGGQEGGERASGLAAEIIPRAVQEHLASPHESDRDALRSALDDANRAIIAAGNTQKPGRRMGTTAVLAVQQNEKMLIAHLGDSRAYLVRENAVTQLTIDHSVADALVRNGALSPEQARNSPWKHVLYKFLGCVEMTEGADVGEFSPQRGDHLLLATDGLTGHVEPQDLIDAVNHHRHPQEAADHLVQLALARGSRDNVTCIVVAFAST